MDGRKGSHRAARAGSAPDSTFEKALQCPELALHVPAHTPRKGSMKDLGQALPLEVADLREVGAPLDFLESVLDFKDGGLVLFTERQSAWLIGNDALDDELHRRSQGNRLMDDHPPGLTGRLHRFHLSAPGQIVLGIADHGPDLLRRARDLYRLLDPNRRSLEPRVVRTGIVGAIESFPV